MKQLIPAAALEQHIVALGKTGAGKSSALRGGFVEPLLDDNQPVCIIDPKGDWWGLKSSKTGLSAGYPIVIFGGEHADVPINEHSGAHVAELFATGNRSCIIDLGGWMVGERTRFFIRFASSLFKLTRGKRWVVMDECHNFAPQGKILDPDAGKMLHWANRLASEGRGKGINIIAASQRPQKVHKDFLTSMETLVAMRVIHKLDRDAIKDWIDGCADPATGKEVIATLASMQRGEAWVWSPEINFGPKRLSFPMFNTYDSFKPQPATGGKLKGWSEVDLDEVRSKMAAVVEEAKANDPQALRKQIADLQQQLHNAGGQYNADDLKQAEQHGFEQGRSAGLESGVASVYQYVEKLYGLISALESEAQSIMTNTNPGNGFVERAFTQFKGNVMAAPRKPLDGKTYITPGVSGSDTFAMTDGKSTVYRAAKNTDAGNTTSLPPGERAVLRACIQYPRGLRRDQLTVLTGYKRSSRDSYIARLMQKAFIANLGDGMIVPTSAGFAAMPDAEPLPKGRALQEFWMNKLPEGERVILTALIKEYPEPVKRDSLEGTGYKRSSRDSYLARLAAKNLVVTHGSGMVGASDDLF